MQVRRVFGRSVAIPVLVALIVALAALAAGGFIEAFRAPPQRRAIVISPPVATTSPVRPAQVQRWIDAGLPALEARHQAAWKAALPTRGPGAHRALAELYSHLAPIPWTGLHALVTTISGQPGVFDVKIEGRPGGAGPPARVVAERLLVVGRSGRRLVVTGDRSPAGIRHEYLMAFRTPHVIVRDGAVVVFDESWRPLAEELAGDMPRARADVNALLGVTGNRLIVVFLYSSSAEVADYLGQSAALKREQFFARLPTTTSAKLWWPTDVGVLASALAPADPWTGHMLAHEVTHTLTWRWFYYTAHAPPLLLEGLATAVEGDRSYLPLRAEVVAGNRSMPLLSTFARPDLWTGVAMARVTLAYLEGGAMVKYILAEWGKAALKRFCVDVADSSLAGPAVKAVVRRDLHVSWGRFYAGWKAYVLTLQ
jgi:hypothetical protein